MEHRSILYITQILTDAAQITLTNTGANTQTHTPTHTHTHSISTERTEDIITKGGKHYKF